MEQWWNDTDWEELLEKNLSQCRFAPNGSHMNWPGFASRLSIWRVSK